MNPITIFVTLTTTAIGAIFAAMGSLNLAITLWIAAAIISQALKMANTWEKFVVLRAGKMEGVKGPGLFVIIPVLDSVVAIIEVDPVAWTAGRRS